LANTREKLLCQRDRVWARGPQRRNRKLVCWPPIVHLRRDKILPSTPAPLGEHDGWTKKETKTLRHRTPHRPPPNSRPRNRSASGRLLSFAF